jgi:hypothetical protein
VSAARLAITAVVIEGRSVDQVSASCGVARSWTYELVAGYRGEGDAAFEPRIPAAASPAKSYPGRWDDASSAVAVHQLTSAAFAAFVTSGELSRSQFCSVPLLKLNQSSPVTLVRPK